MPHFNTPSNRPSRRFGTVFSSAFLLSALLSFPSSTTSSPCVAFDSDFNLYALGIGSKDFSLGTQDSWKNKVNAKDITSKGRPDFSPPNTTCYLSQFNNAIYAVNADSKDPTSVFIYNAKSQAWSTQTVGKGGPNLSGSTSILDHDTNVFYAVDSGTGEMSSLNLGDQTDASPKPLSWNDVGNVPPAFYQKGSGPATMALAENHIQFLNPPKGKPGNAQVYVIHFNFFQPEIQAYPTQGGGNDFPLQHGQTASFFKQTGVQQEFAFIPDDQSATYVTNAVDNTTISFPAPPKASSPTYATSTSALVQLDTSSGSLSFMPWATSMKTSKWTPINVSGFPAISSSGSGSGGNGGNTSSRAGANSGSGTGTSVKSTSNDGNPSATGGSSSSSSSNSNDSGNGDDSSGAEKLGFFKIGGVTAVFMGLAVLWL